MKNYSFNDSVWDFNDKLSIETFLNDLYWNRNCGEKKKKPCALESDESPKPTKDKMETPFGKWELSIDETQYQFNTGYMYDDSNCTYEIFIDGKLLTITKVTDKRVDNYHEYSEISHTIDLPDDADAESVTSFVDEDSGYIVISAYKETKKPATRRLININV